MPVLFICGEDSNRKGVGETLVSPWRKEWENRGFPRGSSPLPLTQKFSFLERNYWEA